MMQKLHILHMKSLKYSRINGFEVSRAVDGPWIPEIIESLILRTLRALAIVMNMSSYIQINQYFDGIPY